MDTLMLQSHRHARWKLFSRGRIFEYGRNDFIIRAGDTPSGVYYINSGWVQVFSICDDGESNIFSTLYPGDIFPLAWAATGVLQDVNFSALANTSVSRVPREEYIQALNENTGLKDDALNLLSRYSYRLTEELDNLQYRTARQRVCYRLFVLAKHFGKPVEKGIRIDQTVSNEYIARSTNMTRETASREMSNLAKKRVISVDGNRIVIANADELKQVLNHEGSFLPVMGRC